ncbi:MAG: protein NO VEIN domain-containing protein [Gemmatimonadaceae bacterium]
MERNHVLGMICGYYLSRFDSVAYSHLGYTSQQATHAALGTALGVPAESIKNWRDEFDPVHDNARLGWHRREMYPSRLRVIEALGDVSEPELLAMIRQITAAPASGLAEELVDAVSLSQDLDYDSAVFIPRGVTGHRAEEAFRTHHQATGAPIGGALVDRRHEQCGFDFEIVGTAGSVFVEVKGMAGSTGGVSFTDHEWRTAKDRQDAYYLAVVRGVNGHPEVTLIQNPASVFQPQMRTYTLVQVGWTLSSAALKAIPGG